MIPFDRQLHSIVAAVTFTSPALARVISANGSPRDIPVAGERDEHGGLALALYADHYSRLTADRSSATGCPEKKLSERSRLVSSSASQSTMGACGVIANAM